MSTQILADLYRTDPRKACKEALRLTRSTPWKERMEAIDLLLETHGVEAIRGEWQNGYWCDIVATYCNTGDAYNTTVLCERGDFNGQPPRFFVGTYGDFEEKMEGGEDQ